MRKHREIGFLLALPALLWACAPGSDAGQDSAPSADSPPEVILGPADGRYLPAKELERVAVGTEAPDFTLRTLAGDTLSLSDFRGRKDVILVFYRGHW